MTRPTSVTPPAGTMEHALNTRRSAPTARAQQQRHIAASITPCDRIESSSRAPNNSPFLNEGGTPTADLTRLAR